MLETEDVNELDGFLTCIICLDNFTEENPHTPTSFRCGHTYCEGCISKLKAHKCPECSTPFLNNELTKNHEVIRQLRMVQIAKRKKEKAPGKAQAHWSQPRGSINCSICCAESASLFCKECPILSQSLCEACYTFRHNTTLAMKSHAPAVPCPASLNEVCCTHRQECKMFCRSCSLPVCTLCTFGLHKGHDIDLMGLEGEEACNQRLHQAVIGLETKTHEVQVAAEDISRVYEELNGLPPLCALRSSKAKRGGGSCELSVQNIQNHFSDLKRRLEEREKELIRKANEICESKSSRLLEQLVELSVFVARSYSEGYNVHQKKQKLTTGRLLQMEKLLTSRIDEQLTKTKLLPVTPVTSSKMDFVPTVAAVSQGDANEEGSGKPLSIVMIGRIGDVVNRDGVAEGNGGSLSARRQEVSMRECGSNEENAIDPDLLCFIQSLLNFIPTVDSSISDATGNTGQVACGSFYGCRYLLDIVLQCRDRRGVRPWAVLLGDIIATQPDAAVKFLLNFVIPSRAPTTDLLSSFLHGRNDDVARGIYVKLLSASLRVIVPTNPQGLLAFCDLDNVDLHTIARESHHQELAKVGASIFVLLIRALRKLLQISFVHLSTCHELFVIIFQLATCPAACNYMLRLEYVPLLIRLLQGEDTTAQLDKEIDKDLLLPTLISQHHSEEVRQHHTKIFEIVAALLGAPPLSTEVLLEDGHLSEKACRAMETIFSEHTQENSDRWTSCDVTRFLEICTESDDVTAVPKESQMLLDIYGENGFLNVEGFLWYMADKAQYTPAAVWKVLQFFQYRCDLFREDTIDGSAAPSSPLSNETLQAIVASPAVLAMFMGMSQSTTVTIMNKLPHTHTTLIVKKLCQYLFKMLTASTSICDEASVTALIFALVNFDDESTSNRLDIVLTGDCGFLTVVLHNHSGIKYLQQKCLDGKINEHQSFARYRELLKDLCKITRVREHVSERAVDAANEPYNWLNKQIQLLLYSGQLGQSFLLDELQRTTVVVSRAGESAVNGNYTFCHLQETNTAVYKKESFYRNKAVVFQIYRCRMDNRAYQWFISIVPPNKEPGTNADEDFYSLPSKYKRIGQSYNNDQQDETGLSLIDKESNIEVKPPEGQWSQLQIIKSRKANPAPFITWTMTKQCHTNTESSMGDSVKLSL